MANRILPNEEKRLPKLSISIETSLALRFRTTCANINSSASREVRKFIIKFLEKHGQETDE